MKETIGFGEIFLFLCLLNVGIHVYYTKETNPGELIMVLISSPLMIFHLTIVVIVSLIVFIILMIYEFIMYLPLVIFILVVYKNKKSPF